MGSTSSSTVFAADLDPLSGILRIFYDGLLNPLTLIVEMAAPQPGQPQALSVILEGANIRSFDLNDVTSIEISLTHTGLKPNGRTLNDRISIAQHITLPVTMNYIDDSGNVTSEFRGGGGDDSFVGSDGRSSLFGYGGNDSLYGGIGKDKLFGGAGNDYLTGNGDNDVLGGGGGDDILFGGTGHDRLFGGYGNDQLSGDDGNDLLSGGVGNDTLSGGAGNDKLFGRQGDDLLSGDDGNDRVHGQNGNDTLSGGDGKDWLHGGRGDDFVSGGDDRDTLVGGDGKDTLVGGAGNDVLHGGLRFDVAIFGGSVYDYDFTGVRPHRLSNLVYVAGADGRDKVLHVEALEFEDYSYFIDGRNNAPFTRPDVDRTDEDTPINLAHILANDFDIDRDPFRITRVEASGSGATVSIAADGTVDYSPVGAFDYLALNERGYDTFIYTVTDSYGGERSETVTIEIEGRNDAPAFVSSQSDTGGRLVEGNSTSFLSEGGSLTFGDKDTSDTHYATSTFVPESSGSNPSIGAFTVNTIYQPDGSSTRIDWTYDVADAAIQFLAQGQTLVETFSTTVHDPHGGTDTIDTRITLVGTNDAPVGYLDTSAVVAEGHAVSIDVLANDTDVDTGAVLALVSARIVSGGGTVEIVGNQLRFDTGTAYEALGLGQSGEAVLEYVLQDEFGAQATSAAFVRVNGLADAATVQALTPFTPSMSVDYATRWHFQRLAEQGYSSSWNNGATQSVNGYHAGFQTQTGNQSMFGLGVGGVNFATTGTVSRDPVLKSFSFNPGFDFELVSASLGISATADAILDLSFSPSTGFSAGTVSGAIGVNTGISGVSEVGGFTQLQTSSSVVGAAVTQTLPQTMTYGVDGAIDAGFQAGMSYSAAVRGPWIPTDLEGGGFYLPDYASAGSIFSESVIGTGSYNLINGSVDLGTNTGAVNFADNLLSHTVSEPINADLGSVSFGGAGVVTTTNLADGIRVTTVKDLVDIGVDVDDMLSFIPQLKALQALDGTIVSGPATGTYVMADIDYITGFDLSVDSSLSARYSVDLLFNRPVYIEGFADPVIALRNADWNNLPGIRAAVPGPVTVTPVFNSQLDYTSLIDVMHTGTLTLNLGGLRGRFDLDIADIEIHESASFGPLLSETIPLFNSDIADIADPNFSVVSVDQFQGDSFGLFA